MRTDGKIKQLIEKVNSDKILDLIEKLEGTDFGLYIPAYANGDSIELIKPGYTQNEADLIISINPSDEPIPEDSKSVAWFGDIGGEDNKYCTHGGTRSCTHCSNHSAGCSHCGGHTGKSLGDLLAPELNYDKTVNQLINYKDLIKELAKEGFGLALLHGHSKKYMFTTLPKDYVSVVANNETSFRKLNDVEKDLSFVPNMWSIQDGKAVIAGGFSN